jgi:hypothetical protein
MVYGIWLALLGVLGAANLIIARRPDAAQAIAKIAPYQGWIGAISALWGVWVLISSILSLGILGRFPILWATWLAVGVVQVALGLLLGIGVIKSFVKQPEAVARMDQMVARLAPKQGLLGLVSIGLGVWMIVAGLLWTVA